MEQDGIFCSQLYTRNCPFGLSEFKIFSSGRSQQSCALLVSLNQTGFFPAEMDSDVCDNFIFLI